MSFKLINNNHPELKWSDRSQKCKRMVPDGDGNMIRLGHTRADIASAKQLRELSGDPFMINLSEDCRACELKSTERPNHPLDPQITSKDPTYGRKDIIQAPQPKMKLVGEF